MSRHICGECRSPKQDTTVVRLLLSVETLSARIRTEWEGKARRRSPVRKVGGVEGVSWCLLKLDVWHHLEADWLLGNPDLPQAFGSGGIRHIQQLRLEDLCFFSRAMLVNLEVQFSRVHNLQMLY